MQIKQGVHDMRRFITTKQMIVVILLGVLVACGSPQAQQPTSNGNPPPNNPGQNNPNNPGQNPPPNNPEQNPPPNNPEQNPPPNNPGQNPPPNNPGPNNGVAGQNSNEVTVRETGAQYATTSTSPQGQLVTGQPASIVLNALGFNQSGGPLSLDHPAGVYADDTRLFVADRGNHRVLIWNTLPTANVPPDIVIGQPDMQSNLSGDGLANMNWPSVVRSDGQRLFVADTNNNRVLVWNRIPTQNGQPADYAITAENLQWPWGLWTDGQTLMVSGTIRSQVLVWRSIPTAAREPDFVLTAAGKFGTPRTITSDGTFLMIGDHNAKDASSANGQGAFVWKSFPTADTPYDFLLTDPKDGHGAWLQGALTPQGQLLALGVTLHVWQSPPTDPTDMPDVSLDFKHDGGDGADVAIAGNMVYVSLYNGDRVLIYDGIPTSATDQPIAALGSNDIGTNPMRAEYHINNPQPYTDGQHLVVVSDFDRMMHVYRSIPDESNAAPDVVYTLPESTWDGELYNGTLLLAGRALYVWNKLPLNGEKPDAMIRRTKDFEFRDVRGVAYDGTYTYLADRDGNRVLVYQGIPDENSSALVSLDVPQPTRLSTDGTYLAVASTEGGPGGSVTVWRNADVLQGAPGTLVGRGQTIRMNLPQHALVTNGMLFIGDTSFNRVQIWNSVERAMSDQAPDIVLGSPQVDVIPVREQNGQDTLSWPACLAFDSRYLWVGGFKFNHRLLRFDVQP